MKNQMVREAIIFIGGLVVGAAGSFYFAKKYYQKKADEEIRAVEAAFTEKVNELEDEKNDALNVASKAIINSNGYNKEDPGSQEFLKNKSTLEGFVKTSAADRTNYTEYFEKNSKETIEVDDHPRDDGEEGDLGSEGSLEAEDRGMEAVTQIGERAISTAGIYEIQYDEYGSKPGYDFKEIYYYVGDGVVVDDEEQFIENPDFILGNVLHDTGFDGDNTRNIYIRNENISTDFEVMKIDGSYA